LAERLFVPSKPYNVSLSTTPENLNRPSLSDLHQAYRRYLLVGRLSALSGCWIPLAIFCTTVAAFLPVLENGFVNWDDGMNFLENPNYRGLSWSHLQWMFTTLHGSNYRPVAWITLGFDYLMWGMEAFGYHLTSLLLHGANGILFYFLARRLLELSKFAPSNGFTLSLVSFFAALLFSTHPLRAEVVAWASARNDLVAAFFSLCTLIAYLNYVTASAKGAGFQRWYGTAILFYVLSLLSKGTGVALPLVFFIFDFYPLRRWVQSSNDSVALSVVKLSLEKMPFIVLAAVAALSALAGKESTAAVVDWEIHGWLSRLKQVCYGLIFYLEKTILPVGLSPLYELTPGFSRRVMAIFLYTIPVVGITFGFWLSRQRWPAGFTAWLYYVVLLAPVLGVIQSGPQLTADRYSYLACLPWVLFGGVALARIGNWSHSNSLTMRSALSFVVGAVCVMALFFLSWRQSQYWKNSETLWRRALAVDEGSSAAHLNLGNALFDRGRLEDAKDHYLRAIEIEPATANARVNLGMILSRQDKLKESTEQISLGLQLDPRNWAAHHALGINLALTGAWDEAGEEFRKSLLLAPDKAGIHFDLARVLERQGRLDEALYQLGEAVRIDPNFPEARRQFSRLRQKLSQKQPIERPSRKWVDVEGQTFNVEGQTFTSQQSEKKVGK
jgi:Flp pilus assembly protein TadD